MRRASRPGGLILVVVMTGSAITAAGAETDAIDGTWLSMARSPLGAQHPAAAWTGDALVVVDPVTARAASYDPVEDAWVELDPAPAPFSTFDTSTWTGTELMIFPDRLSGDPMALEPAANTWRVLSPMPSDIYSIRSSPSGPMTRSCSPVAAHHRLRRTIPWKTRGARCPAQEASGSSALRGPALRSLPRRRERATGSRSSFPPWIDTTGDWTAAAPGPVSPAVGPGLWVDGVLAYLRTDDEIAGPESDAAYDPASDAWRPLVPACGVYTIEAVAAGSVIVLGTGRAAMDVATGECGRFEQPAAGIYGGGVRVWTGDEVLFWSGIKSLDGEPQRLGTRLTLGETVFSE